MRLLEHSGLKGYSAMQLERGMLATMPVQDNPVGHLSYLHLSR